MVYHSASLYFPVNGWNGVLKGLPRDTSMLMKLPFLGGTGLDQGKYGLQLSHTCGLWSLFSLSYKQT